MGSFYKPWSFSGKEALDTFFEMIGPEGRKNIQVVTTDQHRGYAESVGHIDLPTTAKNRSTKDQAHMGEVTSRKVKISRLELIQEHLNSKHALFWMYNRS